MYPQPWWMRPPLDPPPSRIGDRGRDPAARRCAAVLQPLPRAGFCVCSWAWVKKNREKEEKIRKGEKIGIRGVEGK